MRRQTEHVRNFISLEIPLNAKTSLQFRNNLKDHVRPRTGKPDGPGELAVIGPSNVGARLPEKSLGTRVAE